mgnify:CR=1 FL=1
MSSPRFRSCAVLVGALACIAALAQAAPAPRPVPDTRLEDVIAAPGTTAPRMLHADLWQGLDQRARLDSLVFVLENGARTCKVLNRDSTWAVDYTWIYPHNVLPERWYDPRSLIRTGDSLHVRDDVALTCTFGTLRVGVHATTLRQPTGAQDRASSTRARREMSNGPSGPPSVSSTTTVRPATTSTRRAAVTTTVSAATPCERTRRDTRADPTRRFGFIRFSNEFNLISN